MSAMAFQPTQATPRDAQSDGTPECHPSLAHSLASTVGCQRAGVVHAVLVQIDAIFTRPVCSHRMYVQTRPYPKKLK